MVSPTEGAGARRVLLRCALVFGLVTIGTVTILVIQFALGVRSLDYVIVHATATVFGALMGTGAISLAHRLWTSRQRRSG